MYRKQSIEVNGPHASCSIGYPSVLAWILILLLNVGIILLHYFLGE